MKVVLMVIFVLAYMLSVLRSIVDKTQMGSAILASVVNITSLIGMLWLAFYGG